jgi:tRNA-specific 2-thiouridylase
VVVGAAPTWCGPVPASPFEAAAQLRAHGAALACTVSVAEGRLLVQLHASARGIAPGQTVAIYDGDRVAGSATIESATSARQVAGT